jgi:DNA-binding PadR family transcriptional regulator
MGELGLEFERGAGHSSAAMRSPVNWALLGLVIQRPSYGYELVQRFERTYGESLELSSPSQVYTALDALVRRSLIETIASHETDRAGGRQPKPHYRATVQGMRSYEQWLACQLQQECRRSRLFARELALLAPATALRVLERYEEACLKQASSATHGGEAAQTQQEDPGRLTARLAAEEDRLAIGAKLAWIEYARRELTALTSKPRHRQ